MFNDYTPRDDDGPVTWVRGMPLYAAHLIVVVLVASMIATALLNGFGGNAVLNSLAFSSEAVMRGEVWRIFTYGLVNRPSLWFVIDMAMIIWFGREVERTFGRRKFLFLYAGLYLLAPLILTAVGLWTPTGLMGQTGGFGLFIAFATLYPNVPMLFNVLAKWVAWILVGIYTLMALSSRDVISLLTLWGSTTFAYAFVRHQQGRFTLPSVRLPQRPARRGESAPEKPPARSPRTNSMREIDALLDKIAESGIHSLTPEERAKLEEMANRKK